MDMPDPNPTGPATPETNPTSPNPTGPATPETSAPDPNPTDTTPLRFGYTIFAVDDVDATLTFFTDAFGMSRRFMAPEGDYGELETGAVALAFAATALVAQNLAAAGGVTPLDPQQPPIAASITLLADDVDAALERAVAAGATLSVGAHDMPWGQRVAYVRDANGILVELATPVPT
jgi:lactoylglutathione lyase